MKQDATTKLNEIHGLEKKLIQALLEIQKCRIPNRDTRRGHDLRFLQVPQVSLDDLAFDETKHERVIGLVLTDYGQCVDETNYVAVSYCWEAPIPNSGPGSLPRFEIRNRNGACRSRCSNHILIRALRYAISQKVPYLWIDQECINQEDEEEKRYAVQTMDIVYSRSNFPLGLLNRTVTDTQSIQALGQLNEELQTNNSTWFANTNGTTIKNAFRFFDALASDTWFTRAWVYQEVWCSHQKMVLLIPSPNSSLEPHSRPGQIPHEISLSFSIARRLISRATGRGMNLAVKAHEAENPEEGSDLERRIRSVYDNLERRFGLDHSEDASHQAGIPGFQSASRALAQLHHLECRDVVDKVDIWGNICNYPVRLNSTQLLARKCFSLSTAMLALALLNGHCGFFRRIEIFKATEKNKNRRRTWMETYTFNILDEAKNAQEWFNDPISTEPRISSVELTNQGLLCRGWIWRIDQKIDLPELKEKYYPGCPSQYTCTIQEFGWDLARLLKERGYTRLEESILRTVGPYSCSLSLGENKEGLVESVKRKILDPAQWYNLLLYQVMYKGYIWVGHLDGETEYQGIFYFLDEDDPPPPLFISTHLSLNNLELPLFAYNYVVLEVEEVESRKEVKVLRCDGRWAGGLWYAPMEAMETCCFPWASI